jgi:hypothetical protein
MSENYQKVTKITTTQTTPPPHHANRITTEDNFRTVSPRAATGRNPTGSRREGPGGGCARGGPRLIPKGWSRPWSGRGGKWGGADPHHPRALTPGAGTEGPSRGKTLSPPRHEGKWCPSVQGGSCSRDWALGGRSMR